MVDRAGNSGPRSGVETGARLMWLLTEKELPIASAGVLAEELKMEESYVRRVCRKLVNAGLFVCEDKPQRGTPPIKVYSVVRMQPDEDGADE
jgi:predicted transcriptional regulator